MRRRPATWGWLVALALLGVACVAGAADAPSMTRERALEALRRADDAQGRRDAVQALAERGTMADVPALVRALRDPDEAVRGLADAAIWEVWSRSGDPEVDRLFALGLAQMTQRQVAESVETWSRIIRKQPQFAEGWNKRATAYFMLGDYERSLADCDEVMKRNPYHYGALSGYGMIYMQLNQPARAVEYFQRALDVNPNLASVRETMEALKAHIIRQRRDTL